MMSSCSEHSAYPIPVICQDEPNDLQKVKEASKKALKNIQSLYNEIMTPKSFSDLEDECNSEFLSHSTPITLIHEDYPEPTQNAKFKRSDLCDSCRKYISYCSSCRRRNKDNGFNQQRLIVHNNLLQPNNKYKNETIPKFNITVPQPFLLTAENIKRQEAKAIKIAKLKEELKKEAEKELKVKVRSQPVPKHVSLPLYEEMAKRSDNRKKERRGKCLEILEKGTKPFNLSASTKTKSKSICDITKESGQFKAKPVPKNILSENVSKRIKDKEKLRKILMTHRAEEMLKQSLLPFSPKPIPRSFSMSNLNSGKDANVKLLKLNIDAITKRLYTVKCKETMENWNNKVLVQNTHNDKNRDSKQNTFKGTKDSMKSKFFPEYALPFYNFPVRMSTSAMLREKQIREELSSRKRKEEQDEIIKEEIARKKKDFLKNIWPRLKSVEPIMNSNKEIEEKVKSFKVSQKIREEEYEKEIEEMMKRVSKQYLLIERQSKEKKVILGETATKSDEGDSEKKSSIEESEKNSSDEEEASEKYMSNKEASEKQLSNRNETEGSEEFESSSATSEKSE